MAPDPEMFRCSQLFDKNPDFLVSFDTNFNLQLCKD